MVHGRLLTKHPTLLQMSGCGTLYADPAASSHPHRSSNRSRPHCAHLPGASDAGGGLPTSGKTKALTVTDLRPPPPPFTRQT
jgi:hypothetical protein